MAEDAKALSQQRFAERAARYVQSSDHATGDDLERLVALANPQAQWEMLDIATGGGHTALAFAPWVAHVVVTDIAPEMLQAAEIHLMDKGVRNATYRIADAEALPFDAGSFDLVTCRIAAHHFPNCRGFVSEVARVLKAAGRFVLQDQVVPADPPTAEAINAIERLRDPSHHWAFSENAWAAMFREAGLVVLHTEQIMKRHELRAWAARQDCSEATLAQLLSLFRGAPPLVREWLRPDRLDAPDATFVNAHLLMVGTKAR